MTYDEMLEKLYLMEETELLELLEVNSEALARAFSDTIEDNVDKFMEAVADE